MVYRTFPSFRSFIISAKVYVTNFLRLIIHCKAKKRDLDVCSALLLYGIFVLFVLFLFCMFLCCLWAVPVFYWFLSIHNHKTVAKLSENNLYEGKSIISVVNNIWCHVESSVRSFHLFQFLIFISLSFYHLCIVIDNVKIEVDRI